MKEGELFESRNVRLYILEILSDNFLIENGLK
jgi:hypothetical protein